MKIFIEFLRTFKISEEMNFDGFINKLRDFIEDAMPEIVIREKAAMQGVLQILRHEDVYQNKKLIPILRLWCRKAAVRISIESDKRLCFGA